ncbi:MAG: cyclase family protein [Pirellulales bacterium]|nr:cyclase family protein [Pirellulales bacterium]
MMPLQRAFRGGVLAAFALQAGGMLLAAEPTLPKISLDDVAAGRAKIVDLAHDLNPQSPYWPGENYRPFELRTIATIDRDGVLSKAFSMPEHLGTHLDAPNHFDKDQISVAQIKPENLFGPGVMIDASGPASLDSDYQLKAEHIKQWEAEHGRIPDGAIVLLHTGWGRHYGNIARYQNKDGRGRMHFPGYSAEVAMLLVKERNIRGLGLDTMSIDTGQSRDFPVHKIVNGAGRYGLENLANLDKLPPRGFYLIVAPIKISTGTGGPTRIFAITK